MKIPVAVAAVLVSCLFAVSPATAQICGDNVRDLGEECDDGANNNLDGCSAACLFEQTHRMIDLRLRGNTDAVCLANQFGGAFNVFPFVSLPAVNNAIALSVEQGTTSILLHFLELEDLTGVDDDALEVGILSGPPVLPGSIAHDGNAASDLDWWYTPAGSLLDAERLPANRLAGSITAGALTTTPGPARVNLLLSGVPASFAVSQLAISFATGASSAPLTSTEGIPPGHKAAEQLDPTLQSFATAGALAAGVPTGRMCGNISALSMAQTPIPPALVGTCPGYTLANTLLDLLVSGCPGAVAASPQPDQQDPAAPPAGAGPPYTLTADASKVVTTCTAVGGGPPVSLPDCLADAAYSAHFRFLSQRVIAQDDLLFADGFETVI